MAEVLPWVYYDSVTSGTTGSATITLFSQTEAATNNQTTNMPVGGRLLASESMEVKEIIAYLEFDTLGPDYIKIMDKAVLEVLVQNNRILAAPLLMFAPKQHLASFLSKLDQTATVASVTAKGGPFKLKIPIILKKGVAFAVKIKVGEGSTPTASDIKVLFKGILSRD